MSTSLPRKPGRPAKPPDAPPAPYRRLCEEDFARLFAAVAQHGSLSRAIREELPGRPASSVYAAIRGDALGLQVRLREAEQQHRDVILSEIRRRAIEGVDTPITFRGEICGYTKTYSDKLLEHYARHFLPDWIDKRSVSDVTTHGDASEPGIWSISASEALSLPADLRRDLVRVLEWLKANRAQHVAELPALEHEPYDLDEVAALA